MKIEKFIDILKDFNKNDEAKLEVTLHDHDMGDYDIDDYVSSTVQLVDTSGMPVDEFLLATDNTYGDCTTSDKMSVWSISDKIRERDNLDSIRVSVCGNGTATLSINNVLIIETDCIKGNCIENSNF